MENCQILDSSLQRTFSSSLVFFRVSVRRKMKCINDPLPSGRWMWRRKWHHKEFTCSKESICLYSSMLQKMWILHNYVDMVLTEEHFAGIMAHQFGYQYFLTYKKIVLPLPMNDPWPTTLLIEERVCYTRERVFTPFPLLTLLHFLLSFPYKVWKPEPEQ